MRILALEPYYGGSHRAVLDTLVQAVEADWTLLTMPSRKWKWRMRGAAIVMAEQAKRLVEQKGAFDLVFCSTFLNLAEFKGLAGAGIAAVPALVYFHENQLVYPNRHTAEWDLQFPLTNITSALSADRCLFNSRWNLEHFLSEIPRFIRQFPDQHPRGLEDSIAERSSVLAPPFDPAAFDGLPISRGERCRIVWPHRWEHDKRPEEFFSAVSKLADEGLSFEVVVAGQSFVETREIVRAAADALGDRLLHCEEPENRTDYARLLRSCDVAVSTADNEFFGLAMIEAAYAGCSVVVPDRLVYPEIYPASCRYRDSDDLAAMLRALIVNRPEPLALRLVAERYTIESLAGRYHEELRRTAGVARQS